MQESNEITIYVAENGDDSNNGSKEAPFESINTALKTIAGKHYDQAVIIISGTITEVADESAMVSIADNYPPLVFKGESEKRKGILDAGGLEKRVMRIAEGNKVTLGANLTLKGGYTNESCGSGVWINGGHLILDGAKVMQNETQFGLCGGIYVGKDSTFVMHSGSIMKNSSLFNGGGVFPDEGGTFTMYGGVIADNSALVSGGGVFVGSDGVFTMYGGVIEGNTSGGGKGISMGGLQIPCGKGGGVCVFDQGVFTMHYGEIRGNRAIGAKTGDDSGSGAGVFVNRKGIFTCEEGKIFKNSAMNFGGGVYNCGESIFRKGCIGGNKASAGGGGVCVAGKGAIFVLENGEIIGNFGGSGGALCTMENGIFRMENGLISSNTGVLATGLFIDSPVTIQGGIIQNNGAGTKLPEVLVNENGKLVFAGGEIRAKVLGVVPGGFEDIREKKN